MSQYCYSPLSSECDSIRLIRLMPNKDDSAEIQIELFECPLQISRGNHLYEALSYVWGNPDEKLPIFIYGCRFDVTVNLHVALLHLRNHFVERILWVDAICIDQKNLEEKKYQVQSMAKIYCQASRVVVWLGEAADGSDLALEEMRLAGGRISTHPSNEEAVEKSVLALLQRPWFRRIWVREQISDDIRNSS